MRPVDELVTAKRRRPILSSPSSSDDDSEEEYAKRLISRQSRKSRKSRFEIFNFVVFNQTNIKLDLKQDLSVYQREGQLLSLYVWFLS